MKKLLPLFIFTVLAFCLISASAQSQKATVYFCSLATIKIIGQVKKQVYLDDKEIADIRPARYFIALIDAGKHSFSLRNKKYGGIEMNFEAGQIYYVQMKWAAGGKLEPAGIELVQPESGAFDIKQLKAVDEKNIKDGKTAFIKLT